MVMEQGCLLASGPQLGQMGAQRKHDNHTLLQVLLSS